MNIFGKSDIGLKRNSNQDSFDYTIIDDDMVYALVCDGMGGAKGGGIASNLAKDCIKDYILKNYDENMSQPDVEDMLKKAIYKANYEIFEMAQKNKELLGMGTTVVLTAIFKDKIHVAHVGDSRAYLVSNDNIKQLTVDHSMVQQMIDDGKLTVEQAKDYPNKNIITRALGIDKNVDIDYYIDDKTENSMVLMCTDGLTNYLDEKTILNCCLHNEGENIIDKLISSANNGGGSDNITVVVINDR